VWVRKESVETYDFALPREQDQVAAKRQSDIA
jgi:hypothetical protein